MREHHHGFREALQADLGPLVCLPEVIDPGRMHRFSTNGKRGDLSGFASSMMAAPGSSDAGASACRSSGRLFLGIA